MWLGWGWGGGGWLLRGSDHTNTFGGHYRGSHAEQLLQAQTLLTVFKEDLVKAFIQCGSLVGLVDGTLSEMSHCISQDLDFYFHFSLPKWWSRNSSGHFPEKPEINNIRPAFLDRNSLLELFIAVVFQLFSCFFK